MAAASLVNAVCELGQQVGFVSNGRDAADRIRAEGREAAPRTRQAARHGASMEPRSERLAPLLVETRRGIEQLLRVREVLARIELTEGLHFAELIEETSSRLPRDATALAILPQVPVESAIALGNLRRAGLAVSVVLILLDENTLDEAYARLSAEGIPRRSPPARRARACGPVRLPGAAPGPV